MCVRATYVRGAMNLLLILSAILSALTGTGLGGRGASQPAVVAERIVGKVMAARPATSGVRPIVAMSMVDVLGRWASVTSPRLSTTPLYLGRLRQ